MISTRGTESTTTLAARAAVFRASKKPQPRSAAKATHTKKTP